MKVKVLLFTLVFFASLSIGMAYEETKTLNLDAGGIQELSIDCGAGSLEIIGEPGLEEIKVKAYIVIKGMDKEKTEEFVEDKVSLSLKKDGNSALLLSKIKTMSGFSLFKSKSPVINLEIQVPQNLVLVIDDSSGSIKVRDMDNDVQIEDGSGSIRLRDIKGNVSIEDGSGEIDIARIQGDLEVEDKSGEILIKDIHGDVDVDDGSGEMNIFDIKGSVTVKDGSGSITINGVKKSVIIKRAGSGSLNIKNVDGKVIK